MPRPRGRSTRFMTLLNGKLQEQLKALRELLERDLPALNDLMRKTGVPALPVSSGTPPVLIVARAPAPRARRRRSSEAVQESVAA